MHSSVNPNISSGSAGSEPATPSPVFWIYEQHFGLTGHPFALAPDPGFFFESDGHRRALAHLRFAIDDGESCMALTGDIGAGKTTLLRKLMAELDPERVAAVLIAGTRFDEAALLAAALAGFGVPSGNATAAERQAALQRKVSALTLDGRRALLVVDEAQHLLPDALDSLTRLARRRQAEGPPLQVLLCGQPAFRAMLEARAVDALRERVSLFCDLSLLGEDETRAYIEHRLQRVGWRQSPSFTVEAHALIHAATQGVPRRINRLCDRLLMAAYQQDLTQITGALVQQTESGLGDELGLTPPALAAAAAPAAPVAPAPVPRLAPADAAPALAPSPPRMAAVLAAANAGLASAPRATRREAAALRLSAPLPPDAARAPASHPPVAARSALAVARDGEPATVSGVGLAARRRIANPWLAPGAGVAAIALLAAAWTWHRQGDEATDGVKPGKTAVSSSNPSTVAGAAPATGTGTPPTRDLSAAPAATVISDAALRDIGPPSTGAAHEAASSLSSAARPAPARPPSFTAARGEPGRLATVAAPVPRTPPPAPLPAPPHAPKTPTPLPSTARGIDAAASTFTPPRVPPAPAAVAGPCTATVAALGLCTPATLP